MPIYKPSQYQVDNMKQGDIVYVRKPNLLYRLYRHYFKCCDKIKVPKYPGTAQIVYNEYYQEDCVLLYYYELMCVQRYDNEVPILMGVNDGKKTTSQCVLKSLQIGLYNVLLNFKNGKTITLPTDYFIKALEKNKIVLKQIDDQRMVEDLLKFQKYKGSYFKKYVMDNNIALWNASYCSVCGKPVKFLFEDNKIIIDNQCTCGNLELDRNEFSYDEFAIWYANQTNSNVKKVYDEFWFKRGNQS